jgi:hypothetical protein
MQSNSVSNRPVLTMPHLDASVVANRDAAINSDPSFLNDPYAQGNEDPFFGANRALADDNDDIDEINVDGASGPVAKKNGNRKGEQNMVWTKARDDLLVQTSVVENVLVSNGIATAAKSLIVRESLMKDPIFAGVIVPGGPTLLKKLKALITIWKKEKGYGLEGQKLNQRCFYSFSSCYTFLVATLLHFLLKSSNVSFLYLSILLNILSSYT